jgi:hypothetical protein
MKLKSFGCSFIFGSELKDTVDSEDITPSRFTWPAILAAQTNSTYHCFAKAGIGNLAIASNVLTQCAHASADDFFVISWTFIDRFDFTDVTNYDRWLTLRPGNNGHINNFYYKNLHSQLRDKITSLIYIKNCIDTLSQRKIPFIMTCIDELLFETEWHTTPDIKLLQDFIRPHITNFDGKNFLSYIEGLGHVTTKNGHADEHAHYDAAQYMLDVLKKKQLLTTQSLI